MEVFLGTKINPLDNALTFFTHENVNVNTSTLPLCLTRTGTSGKSSWWRGIVIWTHQTFCIWNTVNCTLEHFLSDQFIRDDVRVMYMYLIACTCTCMWNLIQSWQVLRGHQRQDSLLGDYCDGAYYKSHPLFSKDSSALQVFIYYDDVEVCNPLGSRAKKHKLGK